MKKDYSLSFVRFTATLLIILCHMTQYLGFQLSWWFNAGMQMFLFLSGFLYGRRDQLKPLEFMTGRLKKLLTDYVIFAILVVAAILILGRMRLSAMDIICFVLMRHTLPGLEHLWFLPYIFLCYLFSPVLHGLTRKLREKSDGAFLLGAAATLVAVELAVEVLLPSSNPAWFNCYVLGMLFAGCEERKKLRRILTVTLVALTLVTNGLRIWVQPQSYSVIFYILRGKWISYAHGLLGISVALGVRWLYLRLPRMAWTEKVLDLSDTYSYDVFLIHPFFIFGNHSIFALVGKAVPGGLLILALTALSAAAIHWLGVLFRKYIPFLK